MESAAETLPMTTSQESAHTAQNPEASFLLSHPGELDDVTSGAENMSDNEGIQTCTPTTGEEVEEVVGFSIGQRQNYMKSARTPAAEKSRAIDHNGDGYFDIEPVDGAGIEVQEPKISKDTEKDPPSQTTISEQQSLGQTLKSTQVLETLPSPRRPGHALQQRSAATRAYLADGFSNFRRRASSGPSTLTDNVRKLIADFPSLSLPNFGNILRDDSSGSRMTRPRRFSTGIQENPAPEKSHEQLDEPPAIERIVDGKTSSAGSVHGNSSSHLLRR